MLTRSTTTNNKRDQTRTHTAKAASFGKRAGELAAKQNQRNHTKQTKHHKPKTHKQQYTTTNNTNKQTTNNKQQTITATMAITTPHT